MSIAVNLRQLREAAGYSQAELARRAGMSKSGVRDIESGKSQNPYPFYVEKLAKSLHVATDDLYWGGVYLQAGNGG